MKKIYFLFIALCFFTGVSAQIINFPDANFKAVLLTSHLSNSIAQNLGGNNFSIDANGDGQIDVSEALQVKGLQISGANVSSMVGILNFSNLENFSCASSQYSSINLNGLTSLKYLYCQSNDNLTSLNLTGVPNLETLNCSDNTALASLNITGLTKLRTLNCRFSALTSLNVDGFINLTDLLCDQNQINSLNLVGLTSLKYLICSQNNMTTLSLGGNPNLVELHCDINQISSLNLSGMTALKDLTFGTNLMSSVNLTGLTNLESLRASDNNLTSLNVNGLTKMKYLIFSGNHLTTFDASGLSQLISLDCNYNNLSTLFIKNGSNEPSYIGIADNPNLKYICADESQILAVQDLITTNGYVNCHVNSYCSFVPGGTYYTIQGSNKLDVNNNGCDALDIPLPNLKYTITNGVNSGRAISDLSGNYNIPVQTGTHTITPVFENPTYFTSSPLALNVTFPVQVSPFTQNFCVTANGIHPDLEVVVLPLQSARPGFDVQYKVMYKNKGNTLQSGTVNLVFNDAVLDLIVSNPLASNQTVNNLSWNFTNLLPFESREITLTLNVNSPMETPVVNGGDVLNYTATITSVATDDLPGDNTFVFNQTVVNSFDPNDKTCLEGTTIAPAKVGEYVHYMIRFENNGTANAQNIVVKDMIDTTKFDINSLVPMKGSHSFVTNITAGNKVEFIFENINLPFDDANNDGYVAFKIKTKPTLVLGDTFSNTASIYFDYNFPIVTNTATTTIAALSRQDFEFSNYFDVYPNPVHDVLNIATKETIEITSINIYNTLGQLVLVIPNAQKMKTVDVSSLSSGNYFIKINSDKGTANTKFIKN